MFPPFRILAAAALACTVSAGAQAGVFQVDTYTAAIGGPFEAVRENIALFAGGASASFTYTGELTFVNTAPQNDGPGDTNRSFFGANAAGISGYSGAGVTAWADYGTLDGFLDSSGSVAGWGHGTLMVFTAEIDTAGLRMEILHDDGVAIYVDDVRVPGTWARPTWAVDEALLLPAGDTLTLVYGRANGTPSVLDVRFSVSAVRQEAAVPEPASLGLLGAGLLGLVAARRRGGQSFFSR